MTDEPLTALLLDADRYPENPYMSLFARALEEQGVRVLSPSLPLFFPLTRSALRNPAADVLCVDWPYDYYIVGDTGVAALDTVATVLRAVTFAQAWSSRRTHPGLGRPRQRSVGRRAGSR